MTDSYLCDCNFKNFISRRDESAGRQHSQYIPKKLNELNLNQGIETTDSTSSNHIGNYLPINSNLYIYIFFQSQTRFQILTFLINLNLSLVINRRQWFFRES